MEEIVIEVEDFYRAISPGHSQPLSLTVERHGPDSTRHVVEEADSVYFKLAHYWLENGKKGSLISVTAGQKKQNNTHKTTFNGILTTKFIEGLFLVRNWQFQKAQYDCLKTLTADLKMYLECIKTFCSFIILNALSFSTSSHLCLPVYITQFDKIKTSYQNNKMKSSPSPVHKIHRNEQSFHCNGNKKKIIQKFRKNPQIDTNDKNFLYD